ncbi:hypothetical protein ACQP1K_28275 [Sphaerimonospora sp. CA-214678]|uniref:hypothetical protein n=1 Tax=Sphaerimonospora sp. CA-214678 TaxID=3240029 RepID=UPI003D935814
MVDRIPEDSPETGPLVRPYIQADPRYATAADAFWSQRRAESTPRSEPPAAGVTPGGDLLSADWAPERADDEPAGHDGRETGGLILDRQPYIYEDGATDSAGFLGSGWRSDEPEEPERRGRGGVLLRVGGVGVAVAAAIWALSAWVGGPVESCTGGECAAKAEVASSPAVSTESLGDSAAEPVATPAATPARSPSPAVRRRTAPTSAPAVTPTRKVVPAQKATPTLRSSAPRPTPTTASRPAVVDPQRNERPVTPSDSPTATSEPTPAPDPTPTQEERRRGGLLDWLL